MRQWLHTLLSLLVAVSLAVPPSAALAGPAPVYPYYRVQMPVASNPLYASAALLTVAVLGPDIVAVGQPSTWQAGVTGGSGPYIYTAVTLPQGFVLDGASGLITGTPTAIGSYAIVVRANDANDASGTSAEFDFQATTSLVVASATSAFGYVGMLNSQTMGVALNAVGAVTWTLRQTIGGVTTDISSSIASTCPGLAFNQATATLAGKPTGPCDIWGVHLHAADAVFAQATGPVEEIQVFQTSVVASLNQLVARTGASLTGTAITNAPLPTWSFVSVPDGLGELLTVNGFAISGSAPESSGQTAYSVTPYADGLPGPPFSLTVSPPLAVGGVSSVSGIIGNPIPPTPLASAIYALGAVTWSVSSGGSSVWIPNLCPGMVFDTATAILSGTPTSGCDASGLTLTATDSADGSTASAGPFSLAVGGDTVAAALTTPAVVHSGHPIAGTMASNMVSPSWRFGSTPYTLAQLITASGGAFSVAAPSVSKATSYALTVSTGSATSSSLDVTVLPPLAVSQGIGVDNVVSDTVSHVVSVPSNLIGQASWALFKGGIDVSATLPILCPGLSFDTATAMISGTPTFGCNGDTFTAKATDSADGSTAISSPFAIVVGTPTAEAKLTTPSPVHSGQPVGGVLASDEAAPNWSFVSSPVGLVVAASAGHFSGVAPAIGTPATYSVTPTANATAAAPFSVSVVPALAVTAPPTVNGMLGVPVSATVSAVSHLIGAASWTLSLDGAPATLSALCPGLNFNAGNALVSGSTTAGCVLSNLTATATDAYDGTTATTPPFMINVVVPWASASLATNATIHAGAVISGTLDTNEATPTWSFAATPAGLALSADGAAFSGVAPATPGLYSFTATATEVLGTATSAPIQVTVLPAMTVTPPAEISGIDGNAIPTTTLSVVSNNVGAPTWSLNHAGVPASMGTLCPGLTLNSANAQVTGAATALCNLTNLTLTVTDSSDQSTVTTAPFSITMIADTAAAVLTSAAKVHPGAAVAGTLSTNQATPSWVFSSSPLGVALVADGVTFSGEAPSVSTETAFAVTALTNGVGTVPFSLDVVPPLAMSSVTAPTGFVGGPLSMGIASAWNSVGPITWALSQGGVPLDLAYSCAGLTFSPATAQVVGTPSATCSLGNVVLTATDSGDGSSLPSQPFAIFVAGDTASAALTSPAIVHSGQPVVGTLATNEAAGSWTFLSNPVGVVLSGSGAAFSGLAPSVPSPTSYSVTARVSENLYSANSAAFALTVIPQLLVSAPLGIAAAGGSPVSTTLATVSNLISTPTWTLKQGGVGVSLSTLCSGLSLDAGNALVSGTPLSPCNVTNLTAVVTDAADLTTATTAPFSIVISGATATTTLTSNSTLHSGDAVTGTLATNETTPIWSMAVNPAGLTITPTGAAFAATAPVVGASTTYYLTATATVTGTAYYVNAPPVPLTVLPPLAASAPSSLTVAVGDYVSQTVTLASNQIGTPVYTLNQYGAPVSLASLCTGLSFSTATAQITGIAGAPCALASLTVTVRDPSDNNTATTPTFGLTVAVATATATLTSGSAVHQGAPIVGTLATNQASPVWTFSYTVGGMVLYPSGTAFLGTAPTETIPTLFSVTAKTTENGFSASAPAFTVTVWPPLTASTPSTLGGVAGNPIITTTLSTATNAIGAVAWTLNQSGSPVSLGTLCPGLSFNGANAQVSGTPTAACNPANLTVSVADSTAATAASSTFHISILGDTVSITPTNALTIHTGDAIAGVLTTNEVTPTWSISASPALTLNLAGASYSGVAPSVATPTTYVITATATEGVNSASNTTSVTVMPAMQTTTAVSLTAVVGDQIPTFQAATVSGLAGAAVWKLYKNGTWITNLSSLCAGLTYSSSTGAISGIPLPACAAAAVTGLTFTIIDMENLSVTTTTPFSITVNAQTASFLFNLYPTGTSSQINVHSGMALSGVLATNEAAPSWVIANPDLNIVVNGNTFTGKAFTTSYAQGESLNVTASENGQSVTVTPKPVIVVGAPLVMTAPLDFNAVAGNFYQYAGIVIASTSNHISTFTQTLSTGGPYPGAGTLLNLGANCPGLNFNSFGVNASIGAYPSGTCSISNIWINLIDNGDGATTTSPTPFSIHVINPIATASSTAAYYHSGQSITGQLYSTLAQPQTLAGVPVGTGAPSPVWTFSATTPSITFVPSANVVTTPNAFSTATFASSAVAPTVGASTVFNVTAKATQAGYTPTGIFTFTLLPALTVTAPNGVVGVAGDSVSQTIATAVNPIGTISWALYQGGVAVPSLSSICPGLSFIASAGKITGAATTACNQSGFTVQATDSADAILAPATSTAFTIVIAADTATATRTTPATVRSGAAVAGTLITDEGTPTWSFASSPAGVVLTGAGTAFSGVAPSVSTPTSYAVTATASENGVSFSAAPFPLTVNPALVVTPPATLAGIVGNDLTRTLATVTHVLGTATWTLRQNGAPVTLSSLCPGLAFNTASAEVTGSPAAACAQANMTVSVTDNYDSSTVASSAFDIAVVGFIATSNLTSQPIIHPGDAVGGTLSVNEGVPSWGVVTASSPAGAAALPLTIVGSAFSGTAPTVTASTVYTFTATATEAYTASTSFSVTVILPLAVGAPTGVSSVLGNPVSTILASPVNLIGAATWTLNQSGAPVSLPSLCPGLAFNPATAAVTGASTATCSQANMTLTVADGSDGNTATSAPFTIVVAPDTATATLTSSASVHAGDAVSGTLATNEAAPSWTFASSPAGLVVTGSGAAFSATAPTVATTTIYAVTATATQNGLSAAAAPFSVTVVAPLAVSTPANVAGVVGNTMSQMLATATNNVGAKSWTLNQNAAPVTLSTLCPGLAFSTGSDAVTGSPTATCNLSNLTVTVTDAFDGKKATSTAFTLTVAPDTGLATLTSANPVHPGQPVAGTLGTNEANPSWAFVSSPTGVALAANGATFSGTAPTVSVNTAYSVSATATQGAYAAPASVFNFTVYPSLWITAPAPLQVIVGNVTVQTLSLAWYNVGTVTWSLTQDGWPITLGNLCHGLSFMPLTATVAGTPSSACSITVVLTATDSDGTSMSSMPFLISVAPDVVTATLTSPAIVHQGAAIAGNLTTNESAPIWSFSSSPATPVIPLTASGNTPTATFSGVAPSVPGQTTYTVSPMASEGGGLYTAQSSFQLTVYPPLSIPSSASLSTAVGDPVDVLPASANYLIGYGSWTLKQGGSVADLAALCPGLTFNTVTGKIAGTPTAPCSPAAFTVTVVNSGDSSTATSPAFTVAVAVDNASATLGSGVQLRSGQTIYGTLSTNETNPTWSFESLPSGIALTAVGATFSGPAPAVVNITPYLVTATATQGAYAPSASSFGFNVVPAVVVAPPANLALLHYLLMSQPVTTATNVLGTATWALKMNGSPLTLASYCPGLYFNTANAVVHGTPSSDCALTGLTVVVTDDYDSTSMTSAPFTLTVAPPYVAATLTSPSLVHSGFPVAGTMITNEPAPVWGVASSPSGLPLAATGAAFNGTAPLVGQNTSYSITVSATQGALYYAVSPGVNLTVVPPLAASGAASIASVVGNAVSQTVASYAHNVGQVTWSLAQGGAPLDLATVCPGLALAPSLAHVAVVGVPTATCSLPSAILTATDSDGTIASTPPFSISIIANAATATVTSPALIHPGDAITGTMSTNEAAPTWSFESSPSGIGLAATSALTFSGTAPFVIIATNFVVTPAATENGQTATSSPFEVTVIPSLAVTPPASISAIVGVTQSAILSTAANVIGTPSWALKQNGSPLDLASHCAGLSFNPSNAMISGLPSATCSLSNVTVVITDSADAQTATSTSFSIFVAPDLTVTTLTSPPVVHSGAAVTGTMTTNLPSVTWTDSVVPASMTLSISGSSFSAVAPTVFASTAYAITTIANSPLSPVPSPALPVTVTVLPPLAVSPVSNLLLSVADSVPLTVSSAINLIGSPTWTLKQNGSPVNVGSLCPGLAFNTTTALITGQAAGTCNEQNMSVTLVDSLDSATVTSGAFSIVVMTASASIALTSQSIVHSGDVLTGTLTTDEALPTWSFASSPAGVYLTHIGATFSGTAPPVGTTTTFSVSAAAVENGVSAAAVPFSLTVHPAMTATAPSNVVGIDGNILTTPPLSLVGNLIGAATWSLNQGGAPVTLSDLCPGLALNPANARISGTPTQTCTAVNLSLVATDSWDNATATSATFSVVINPDQAWAFLDSTWHIHGNEPVFGHLTTNENTPIWTLSTATAVASPPLVLGLGGASFVGTSPAVTIPTTYVITATATEGFASPTASVSVTVEPPITVTGTTNLTVTVGDSLTAAPFSTATVANVAGTASWTLYDNGAQVSNLSAICGGLSFSTSTGQITGIPDGTHMCNTGNVMTVKVTDSEDGTFAGLPPGSAFSITINPQTASALFNIYPDPPNPTLSTLVGNHSGMTYTGVLTTNEATPQWTSNEPSIVFTGNTFTGTAPVTTGIATASPTFKACENGHCVTSAALTVLTRAPVVTTTPVNLVSAVGNFLGYSGVTIATAGVRSMVYAALVPSYSTGAPLAQGGTPLNFPIAACPGLQTYPYGNALIGGYTTGPCTINNVWVNWIDTGDGSTWASATSFNIVIAADYAAAAATAPEVHQGDLVTGTLTSNENSGAQQQSPYWTISSVPTLPALTLTPSPWVINPDATTTATFSGTAPTVGSVPKVYTVTARAAQGAFNPASVFTVTVDPPLTLNASVPLVGNVGSTVAFAPATANYLIAPAVWTLKQAGVAVDLASFCPGLKLDAASGKIVGAPSATCAPAAFTLTVVDSSGDSSPASAPFTVSIISDTASAVLTSASPVHSGKPVSGTLATNEAAPSWTFASNPAGIALTGVGTAFSGVAPTVTDNTLYTVTASAAQGAFSQPAAPFAFTVYPPLAVSPATPVAGVVGNLMFLTLDAAWNNIGVVSWALTQGGTPVNLAVSCPGLAFDPTTALVSGAPTQPCSLPNVVLTATDAADATTAATPTFEIAVFADTASVSMTSPSSLHSGVAISGTLTSNENAPVWSIAATPAMSLPVSGGAFSAAAPAVSVPTVYNFIATGAEGASSATVPFAVTVFPPLAAPTPANLSGVRLNALSTTLAVAVNPIGATTWTLNQNGSPANLSALCPGLAFSTAAALVNGTPTATCNLANMTVTAADAADGSTATSGAFAIAIAPDTALATLTSAAVVHQGHSVSGTLATNESAPSWTFASAPAGLSLTASGGAFSGSAPMVSSASTYTVTATASGTDSAPFSVTVVPSLAIAPPGSLVNSLGDMVAQPLPTVSNNIGAVSWALYHYATPVANLSDLCPGLSFSTATGQITGIPTALCSHSGFHVMATDAADSETAVSVDFSVTVSGDSATATLVSASTVHPGAAINGTLTTDEEAPTWSFAISPTWTGAPLLVAGSSFAGNAPSVAVATPFSVVATATENGYAASALAFPLTVLPPLSVSPPANVASVRGDPLNHTLSYASNVIGTPTWSIQQNGTPVSLGSLCAGLNFNAATSAVTGPSTATCNLANLTVTVADSADATTATSAAFALVVGADTATATRTSAATVHPGDPVSGTLASNEASATWSFASVPTGLSLTGIGGNFSGTAPSVAATYSVTATATENGSTASAAAFSVTVVPPLAASAPSNVASVRGNPLSQTLSTAANVIGTPTWTIQQNGSSADLPSLCAGLAFNPATSAVTGPSTATCTLANMTVTVADSADGNTATSAAFTIVVGPDTATATLTSAASVHPGGAIAGTLATDEASPTWSFVSAPAGLSVSASGASFSGTAPATAALYSVTATATENGEAAVAPAFSVTVVPAMTVSPGFGVSGVVGNGVSQTLAAAADNIGAVAWALSNGGADVSASLGTLCPGLAFNPANAQVTGAPSATCALAGLTLTATDPSDASTATSAGSISIAAANAQMTLSSSNVRQLGAVGGTLTTNEASPTWTFASTPTGLSLSASGGAVSGTAPVVDVVTIYTATATATDGAGSASSSAYLTVYPPLSVSPPANVASVRGNALNQTLSTASNVIGTPTWTIRQNGSPVDLSSLCAGLAFNAATSDVTGSPTATCDLADMTVAVADSFDGTTATSAAFAIVVGADTATATLTSAATVHPGDAVSVTLASNENAPSWTYVSSPAGLALTGAGSTLSGSAPDVSTATTYSVTATATENGSTANAVFSVTVLPPLAASAPSNLATAVGAAVSTALSSASNLIGTPTWTLNQDGTPVTLSSLCPGLAFGGSNGQVTGTPTSGCSLSNMTVTVADYSDGLSATSAAFSIQAYVDGACSATMWQCAAGSLDNVADSGSTATWSCNGSNGGSAASCTQCDSGFAWDGASCAPIVTGACGAAQYSCTAGAAVGGADSGSTSTWTCDGANGGGSASCSACDAGFALDGTTCAPIVTGVCGAALSSCDAGTLDAVADGGSTTTWTCGGSNGGGSASCSGCDAGFAFDGTSCAPIVAGACGDSQFSCAAGAAGNVADSGTTSTWSCDGANGGATASCSACDAGFAPDGSSCAPIVTGVCGASLSSCDVGALNTVADSGSTTTWSCDGANGGGSASCSGCDAGFTFDGTSCQPTL